MHMSIIIIAGSMLQVTVIRKDKKQNNQRKWTQKRRSYMLFFFSCAMHPTLFRCAGLQVSKDIKSRKDFMGKIRGSGIVAKIKRKMRMEKKNKKKKRKNTPQGVVVIGSPSRRTQWEWKYWKRDRWAKATTRILGADRSGGGIWLGTRKVNSVQIQVGNVVIMVDARAEGEKSLFLFLDGSLGHDLPL